MNPEVSTDDNGTVWIDWIGSDWRFVIALDEEPSWHIVASGKVSEFGDLPDDLAIVLVEYARQHGNNAAT